VTCAVVGLPLNMMGEETPQTKSCISFAMNLEEALNMPVLLWDERLSTVSATNALFEQRQGRQTRASKKDIKKQVDSVAAALFLQAVLESLRHSR
jgi:putative Holliday junction resolvase